MLASGCYCSHPVTDDAGPGSDAGADGGHDAGGDAGQDAGWDASVFEPPPGVCTPPLEYARDRFPGDTQRSRDDDQARSALFRECSPGESCVRATFTVGADGRVDGVTATDPSDTACVEAALVGLCLPTYLDDGGGPAEGCGL